MKIAGIISVGSDTGLTIFPTPGGVLLFTDVLLGKQSNFDRGIFLKADSARRASGYIHPHDSECAETAL